MNIINLSPADTCRLDPLRLGYRGTYEVAAVAFDFSAWVEEYGPGTMAVFIKRPTDASPYPAALQIEGTVATWTISETDTLYQGSGEIEFVYTNETQRQKSAVFATYVFRDIGAPASDPPDPYENWLDRLTELAGATQQNAADAAAAATEAERQADAAEENADLAIESARSAGQSEAASAESALAAEGFAVGEQNGEAVQSGSPYFENNSKFYSEQAQQAAAESGWVHFYIDENGDLHYVKTPNVAFAFFLQDGDLYVRA